METEDTTSPVTPVLVRALLVTFLVVSLLVIVGDYASLAFVSKGVSLAGHDLGNMSRAQVRAAVDSLVAAPAMQPLSVEGSGTSWSLDPKGIVTVNTDAIVEAAYAPSRNTNMFTRLYSRIAGVPLTTEVKPTYTVATSTLEAWIAQTAATVNTKPVDATRTVVKYELRVKPERYGQTVNETRAVEVLSQALTADVALQETGRVAQLPIDRVAPKVLASKFKTAIVVSITHRRVYLYDGAKLVKSYPCAPGQVRYPTPLGDFVIVRKQKNAPWINPGSDWAKSMPHSIPGGPGNPMGDRKIGINYPGVFLHGIPASEYSSIGTRASHGCMRMMPSAIHDLFPRVKIGNPVFIRF